jgi:hypothetical protein
MPSAAPATRGAEDVQRLHRQLEAAVDLAEQRAGRHPAAVEHQRGQRVRRHHVDGAARVQARVRGVHDEGADAPAAALRVGLGEHAVKIGQSAVADPGFGALKHKI